MAAMLSHKDFFLFRKLKLNSRACSGLVNEEQFNRKQTLPV